MGYNWFYGYKEREANHWSVFPFGSMKWQFLSSILMYLDLQLDVINWIVDIQYPPLWRPLNTAVKRYLLKIDFNGCLLSPILLWHFLVMTYVCTRTESYFTPSDDIIYVFLSAEYRIMGPLRISDFHTATNHPKCLFSLILTKNNRLLLFSFRTCCV